MIRTISPFARTTPDNHETSLRNIGIIGAGNISGVLARRLPTKGHQVKIANSRGPETLDAEVTSTGAHGVTAEEAATDVDVLILSIPLSRIPDLAPVVGTLPAETVVIDTGNYYPARDGAIEALDSGQVESEWVSEQLGRPVLKAWNAILAERLVDGDREAGDPQRTAIPVAGDGEDAKSVAVSLVEDSGFDAVDAGSLAESWRQQPGSPVYCTSLTAAEVPGALAAAQRDRLAGRRDLAIAVITDRAQDPTRTVDGDFLTRLNRVLYQ